MTFVAAMSENKSAVSRSERLSKGSETHASGPQVGASDEKPATQTSAEVLRGALAGEPWAHAALYDALYPTVARALQKVLHYSPDYDDLVQTSFELIVRTLKKPQARSIENLAAWSSVIAARVALDALRARVRERRVFNRDAQAEQAGEGIAGPKLERQLDVRSDLAWLQGSLASMNAEQAEAVVLHDVLGHDLWEIATLTGVSSAAAQKRLSRGHLELRQRAERRTKGVAK
jgi:RNA polymerase sigma factor (sigma-70 family)